MSIQFKLCAVAILLSACSEVAPPVSSNSEIVPTPYIIEAQQAGAKKFGESLIFQVAYQNKEAVCGEVKKDGGEPQQFIYVRNSFLLQEVSPSGEWESQWFSECDDG